MLDLCKGSISFLEDVKGKFIMSLLMNKKVTSLPKKTLLTIEMFIINEEVDKGTKDLDDMKEAVFTIRRMDLDHF